jgi:hypothetical protein
MEVGNLSGRQGKSNGVFACLFLHGERGTPRRKDGAHEIDGEFCCAVPPWTRSMSLPVQSGYLRIIKVGPSLRFGLYMLRSRSIGVGYSSQARDKIAETVERLGCVPVGFPFELSTRRRPAIIALDTVSRPVDHYHYHYARARSAAGPRAAGASGRDLWGRRSIAGLLRTAAGAPLTIIATPTRARGPPRRRRPLSPISFCVCFRMG